MPAVLDPPPAAAPVAAPAGPLADLVLARLLPAANSVGLAVLAKDVGDCFRRPPARAAVAEVVAELRAAGLLEPGRGHRLSEAGRERAREFLGVDDLPPRATWTTVKATALVARAVGLPAADVPAAGPKLAALLVRQKFGLPAGAGDTPAAVLEAVACKLLGFPGEVTLAGVKAAVISRHLELDPPLDAAGLRTHGSRLLLGVGDGVDKLRALALLALTDAPPTAEPDPEPFDLEAFAATVQAVARRSPTGRFGDNKVFIAHVWRQVADEPHFNRLGPDGFKAKLVEANRLRLLTLSRADLPQFLDPADVRESATEHLGSAFHFVLAERG